MDTERMPSPVDDIAGLLVQWAGMGSMILVHMSRSPDGDCPLCVQEMLFELILGTLRPLGDRYALADLEVAAGALGDAIKTISEEILLVGRDAEPDPPA
jgi:hypothetical protein